MGGASRTLKYHDSWRQFTYFVALNQTLVVVVSSLKSISIDDLRERHSLVGSLAGAAHLLNDNTGVLREAQ